VWQLRYIIIAVAAPIAATNTAFMIGYGVISLYNKIMIIKNGIMAIATGFQIAYATVVGGSTSATAALGFATAETTTAYKIFAFVMNGAKKTLAALKDGTLGHLLVEKAFAAATIFKTGLLNILTGGQLTNAAATASMAVANGTATVSQWLLNAAMNANPVGLVVVAIAALVGIIIALVKWGKKAAGVIITIGTVIGAIVLGPIGLLVGAIGLLISGIVEVVRGWGTVNKAFEDGGFLAGLKQGASLLLSGILAPIQGLLEVFAKIPGVDKLLGPAVQAIKSFRQNLTGIDETAIVKTKIEEPPTSDLDAEMAELMAKYNITMPEMDMPDFNTPDFNTPDFSGGFGEAVSKLHGVVDISGGAGYYAPDDEGTYTTTGALASAGGASPAIPESLTRAMIGIAAILRRIDASVTKISNLPVSARSDIPEITAPVSATRASLALPRVNMSGDAEEDSGYFSRRAISPITQAERAAYSTRERREKIVREVVAGPGTAARVVRAPRDVEIQLVTSGGNA
jgi:hypothetical protein